MKRVLLGMAAVLWAGLFVLMGFVRADIALSPPIRAGIIGLDTSHAIEFTRLFNNPKAPGELAGIRIVVAYPGGSADLPGSRDRVGPYTRQIRTMGVRIVASIPELLRQVDVVLLESVDGRPHLAQARPVFEAGKPLFIDKPLAGSLADAIAIAQLGQKYHVPWFCSSSLRFGPKLQELLADHACGRITGCDAWSPCPLEKTQPDLYWYGVHGCELLYTVMGPGCVSVSRTSSQGSDVVVGTWKDGRIGVFRGIRQGRRDYGAVIFGTKKIAPVLGFEGYKPLVEQIARFFRTRRPPVSADETIELYSFMSAADQSKREGGRPVAIEKVMEAARAAAASPRSQNSR